MAKITRHVCDFNVNLREHDSHWFLSVRVKDGEPKEFDLCSKHILQSLTPLLNANGFRDVTIRKSSEVAETPQVGSKASKVNTGYRVASCLECGVEQKNIYSHVRIHGMEYKEYAEKHGLKYRDVTVAG